MSALPDFSPVEMLERLLDHGVDFVVIGGVAVLLHGSARLTTDLDITYATDATNLELLGEALVGLGARMRDVEDEVPFVPDGRTLRQTSILCLQTGEGILDVLAEPAGCPPYPVLRARAERHRLGARAVLVASLEDLIAMKQAAGRTKDLVAIEELETIRRLRRR